ncbi:MAG: helix-turn-helix domain-containing protein [Dehalococcoidia bacterium]|nr:helix-turn-helix domain-containing protein [Dehalococcoidia bacterium]
MNKLREYREKAGLSQVDLERQTGIACPNISAIERGTLASWPKARELLALALEVDERVLFPGEQHESEKQQKKRFEIIDLAIEKGWFINPSKGMELFIQNIIQFGRCPCDESRPDCPCPESAAEVADKGRCRCGLYWASYQVFRNTVRPLKGEENERKSEEEVRPAHPGRAKKRSRPGTIGQAL